MYMLLICLLFPFSLRFEDSMAHGRHLAVADSSKAIHIVDVTQSAVGGGRRGGGGGRCIGGFSSSSGCTFFRRVTYDSDWPITLAEQALFVQTLATTASQQQQV